MRAESVCSIHTENPSAFSWLRLFIGWNVCACRRVPWRSLPKWTMPISWMMCSVWWRGNALRHGICFGPKWKVSKRTVFWTLFTSVSLIHAGHRLAVPHHWSVDDGTHYSRGQVQLWTQCNHRVACQRFRRISADQRGDGQKTGGQHMPGQNHPGLLMTGFSMIFWRGTTMYKQKKESWTVFCRHQPRTSPPSFSAKERSSHWNGNHMDAVLLKCDASAYREKMFPRGNQCRCVRHWADSFKKWILLKTCFIACWMVWSRPRLLCLAMILLLFWVKFAIDLGFAKSPSFLLLRIRSCLTSAISKLKGPFVLMLYCFGFHFDLEPKESAGKSTILEQLAMLPFFPRKRRCCTRLAIHVRLRRTPGISRATLTVLDGKGEEQHWREIPQENGWLVVQVQCLGWYGGAKWSILERPHVVHGRFEWATQTQQVKSKAELHGGLLGMATKIDSENWWLDNFILKNVIIWVLEFWQEQCHISYHDMLQRLTSSDGDAFYRTLKAFSWCLQEEMERLQEEVERSQQECCENVSGCDDDGWLSKCSSLMFFACFFCCEHLVWQVWITNLPFSNLFPLNSPGARWFQGKKIRTDHLRAYHRGKGGTRRCALLGFGGFARLSQVAKRQGAMGCWDGDVDMARFQVVHTKAAENEKLNNNNNSCSFQTKFDAEKLRMQLNRKQLMHFFRIGGRASQ